MKQIMKRRVAAALAAVLALSTITLFTGCKDNPNGSESTPFGTLPPGPLDSTTSESSSTSDTTTESSSTESSSTVVNPPPVVGQYTNPLTGMPTTVNLAGQRPLAIVVDNIDGARERQTGLDQADVLYESLTAPGITRFLAVYADYSAVDSVRNIRSGRDYHLDWAAQHNAVLMCHGGSITAHYDFYQLALERLGSRWGYVDTMFEKYFSDGDLGRVLGTIKDYDTNKRVDLKYDTCYNPAALDLLLASDTAKFVKEADGSLVGNAKQSLKFVPYGTDKNMAGASSATTVSLNFMATGTALAERVSFSYDASTDKYLRSQDGAPHLDAQTGKQLSFTNVITLLTDVRCVSTGIKEDPYMTTVSSQNPNGVGYYFHGGKVIQLRWYSDGNTLSLIEPNGNELTLATGNTYIGYLDSSLVSGGYQFWS